MNLFSEENRRDPYPLYERLRAASPVVRDPRSGAWLLFDFETVKRALTEHETFSSVVSPPTSQPGQWLIFADPPRHTKLRVLVTRAFTSRTVAGLEPRIRELARQLLDAHVERGTMDLVGDFAMPLPLMVIAELLGVPAADYPRFRRWSDGIAALADTLQGGDEAERAVGQFAAAASEMHGYVAALVEARRSAPTEDLLSKLVHAEVDGDRLTLQEILGFFQLLLFAGHETTTNLIDNAVLCLLAHRDQMARLTTEPGLLPSAIEEVLRFRSPVQAAFRLTTRDVELRGQSIPRGSLVLAMIGSANRDPAHFADAARFDIARDPNPHIAFGHGIHFCVGAPLARLESRIALAELLSRARGLALASDEPWEPRPTFHVHGPSRLPVRFERGHAAPPRMAAQPETW